MAKCTIILYYIENLDESKNFVIDGMPAFLSNKDPFQTINDFQYIRFANSQTIKLNADQSLSFYKYAAGAPTKGPNYCIVRYPTNAEAFYFITNIRQKAPETIELDLQLDVLNTFSAYWRPMLGEKTRILREHRDRFSGYLDTDTGNIVLESIFSRTDEGESLELIRSGALQTINDQRGGAANTNFFLIFRTDNNGVPCVDLCANKELLIGTAGSVSSYTLPVGDMVSGRYYYILGNLSVEIHGRKRGVMADGTKMAWNPATWYLSGDGMFIFYKNSAGRIAISFVSDNSNLVALSGKWEEWPGTTYGATHEEWESTISIVITQGKTLYYSNNLTYDQAEIKTFSSTLINVGGTDQYIASIDTLDRTDSHLVKVIECPYCPIDYEYNWQTGIYTFDDTQFLSRSPEGYLRDYDIGKINLHGDIQSVNLTPEVRQLWTYGRTKKAKGTLSDPKLKTSPFNQPTYIYDSFSQIFKYEDLEPYQNQSPANQYAYLDLTYRQSNAISSNLYFGLNFRSATHRANRKDSNFPDILPASRNNEIPLYSSEYLNYIRNGYNYDKKKLKEQTGQNAILAAVKILGAAVSFALTSVTGGVSAAAGIGVLTSGITAGLSQPGNYRTATQELEQKINLLKAQGFNVSGIDDIDLFKHYAGNKLLFASYVLKDEDRERLENRFYYFGYASNRYGRPQRSRKYFDFLQCEAVFDFDGAELSIGPNIWQLSDHLDLIKEKLAAGVTIFWSDGLARNNFKLTQDMENIETWIYNQAHT